MRKRKSVLQILEGIKSGRLNRLTSQQRAAWDEFRRSVFRDILDSDAKALFIDDENGFDICSIRWVRQNVDLVMSLIDALVGLDEEVAEFRSKRAEERLAAIAAKR